MTMFKLLTEILLSYLSLSNDTKDTIIMLTWREHKVLLFDADTLSIKETKEFDTFTGEGWGITHDGTQLIISDGSHWLHFWDPVTLEETRRIEVYHPVDGRHETRLNELEYIPGANVVLANVWYKDYIVAINPATGEVVRTLDFTKLLKSSQRHGGEDCFNGIAFNATAGDELYLTGKWWGHVFKLRWKWNPKA
eukprot:m.132866 g.132866  ORF g.132866 m.132866 type:complete len:194 (-) comp17511_c0_seq12:368-949(-)